MNRRPYKKRTLRSATCRFESLEDRRLLTVADISDLSPALRNAFENASDLSAYTQDQIDSASTWVVATRAEADLVELADTLGVTVDKITESSLIGNTYVVDISEYETSGTPPFAARVGSLLYGYPIVSEIRSLRFVADDPLFGQQWNLNNTGQVSPDALFDHGFVEAWEQDYTGDGVVISIVDEGVELNHPDLATNVIAGASYDFLTDDTTPEPSHPFASHGTSVAGIAAARGGNTIGISGAAPKASLAAVKLPFNDRQTDLVEADAVRYAGDTVDIYNHSWGPNDDGIAEGPGPLFVAAIEQTIRDGRDGKGAIHVWAAGNGALAQDDVNLDGYANLRYTIATAAIDAAGVQTSYSESGSPVFISAMSSNRGQNVVSTDLVGDRGINAFADGTDGDSLADLDYTSNFGGTSAAAPVVSGAIALMLEANPNLTWRDVQHILANSAAKNDPSDSQWKTNAAGFDVNYRYGFGGLDVAEAIQLAKSWTNVGEEIHASSSRQTSNLLLDGVNVKVPFVVNDVLNVEWVEVTIDAQHSRRGDLEITLTSPSGTESVLASSRDADVGSYNNWVFTTARNWGERSTGVWQVNIRDAITGETGQLENVQIDIYGTRATVIPDTGGDQGGGDNGGGTGGDGGQGSGGQGTGGDNTDNGSGSGNDGGNSNSGGGNTDGGGSGGQGGGSTNGPVVVGSIKGFVYESANATSNATSSRGVGGISIYLDMNGDGRVGIDEPRVRTGSDGSFHFDKVPRGNYAVRMVPTAGWIAATPETRNVNLRGATEEATFAVRSHRDYGDAPFPYSTRRSDGGAVHTIDDLLFLGGRVDPDSDGIGNTGANYDDINGTDDEDGIEFTSRIIPGKAATLAATASRSGVLQGWIDFNADGDWSDAGEQIIANRHVSAGVNQVTYVVPRGLLSGTTYARFRISDQIDVRPSGMAIGGEVEDYVVLIGTSTTEITAPVAKNDFLVVLEDSKDNALNVLTNDSIPLSGANIVSISTPTTRGVVLIGAGGGSLEYTPPVRFVGTDTFTYTIANITGATSVGSVTVRVDDVIEPPTARNDSYSLVMDTQSALLSVLSNDATTNGTLRIQSVAAPNQGGTVSVSADSKGLVYSPLAGYTGLEEFSYTIVDASGSTKEATVSITLTRQQQSIDIELVAEDEAGNVLTNIRPGDEYKLVGYVTDLRSEPLGLFAAYFDVTYNPSVAKVNGPIARGDSFQRVLSGTTATAGLIDEVGGTGEITLLDGERYMVFSVPMKSIGTGNANFASNPADISPAHQVLLFGINDPIGSDQIVFGKSELFVRNFTNPSQPLDSNGDGFISPIDALLIVNELNTIGGRTLSKTLAIEKVPSFFADVNGDGALSPIDALVVINKLNSIKRGEGENPNDVPVPLVDAPFIDRAEIASAFLADDLNGEETEHTDSKRRLATDEILADEFHWV